MPETAPHNSVHEAPVHTPGDVLAPANHEISVTGLPISYESITLSSLGYKTPFEKLGLPSMRRDQDGQLSLAEEPLTLADLPTEHARLMQKKSDLDNREIRMEAIKQGAWFGAIAAEQRIIAEARDLTDVLEEEDDEEVDKNGKKKAATVTSLVDRRAAKELKRLINPQVAATDLHKKVA